MDYVLRIQSVMQLRCPKQETQKKKNELGKDVKVTVHLPWALVDQRETVHSYDMAFLVPSGYSAHDLRQETDSLYAACGAPVSIIDRGGRVIVSVNKADFPDVIPYDPAFLQMTKGREVLCGFDLLGKPITHNFRVPHVLIGAQSGYGKTDLLRWWMYQLIARFTPDQLHIDIIDGKGFSFLPFRGIPHIRRIVRDLAGASAIMRDAKKVMNDRSNKVWESGDRDKTNTFQWRLVIVDELAVISPGMQVSKSDKEIAAATYADMAAVACVGREAGVGMIMATQRPDANVVHPQVKQNCDVSIAMKCKTVTNSEIILDRPGAEQLPHGKPGRAIYSGMEDCIFQIPYIGKDDKWNELLNPYRKEIAHDEPTPIDDLGNFV